MTSRQSKNLLISMPRCRCCGRFWRPQPEVAATSAFCAICAEDRHAAARRALDLRPLNSFDLADHTHLLPRAIRR